MSKTPQNCEKRVSKNFKKRLLHFIYDQGCTQTEFAQLARVNKEVVSRATNFGIIPSVKSLVKIADYLHVSIPYLLAETDKNDFIKSDAPSDFHTRIEALREEKSTKYSVICRTMPFSKNSFYEWLRTKSIPTLEYLEAIAKYFDVTIDYLLGRTDYKN